MRFPSPSWTIFVAVSMPLILCACSDPEPKKANVILITLDTLRADYLTCYGSTHAPTPHLDSLAKTGVRFARAQSASAVTPVSHATILTGRLPYEHGLRVLAGGGGFQLADDQPSIATTFKGAGYRTAAIQSAFPVSRTFGLEQGFDLFEDLDGTFQKGNHVIAAAWDVNALQRRSDLTTNMALEFIDSSDEPFFLWIHYWDPHDAQLLPPEDYTAQHPLSKKGISTSEYDAKIYSMEVGYQDLQVGRLFDGLRQRGLMDDMLIAATADHGEGLVDGLARHDWYYHRMTYQEQLHVPMLFAGPGVPSGFTDSRLVSTADLAPTLLELAGLQPTPGAGKSLLPLGEGASLVNRMAYSDQINAFDWNAGLIYKRPDSAFLYTVTDGDWKLTYRPHVPFASSELYHLTLDPGEKHNKIGQRPNEFRALAEDLATRNPWVFEPFDGVGMDETSQDALANIGYSHLQASGGLNWWWQCALHADKRLEHRGRCGELSDGKPCAFPLLPRTDWQVPTKPGSPR